MGPSTAFKYASLCLDVPREGTKARDRPRRGLKLRIARPTARAQSRKLFKLHDASEIGGLIQPATPRPVSTPTRAGTSRWNSPRLEIIVGAVLLAFFAFVQAVNLYEYLIGAVDFPVIGLTVFFILWGIGLIVHGVIRRNRFAPLPPFPGYTSVPQAISRAAGSEFMACPRCGATVHAEDRFCLKCGFQGRQ